MCSFSNHRLLIRKCFGSLGLRTYGPIFKVFLRVECVWNACVLLTTWSPNKASSAYHAGRASQAPPPENTRNPSESTQKSRSNCQETNQAPDDGVYTTRSWRIG